MDLRARRTTVTSVVYLAIAFAFAGCTDDSAYDSTWYFAVQSATINPTKPDGSAWETDGSAPDPFARVTLNGAEVLSTHTLANTFTPEWGDTSVGTDVNPGMSVLVDVIDSDPAGDEPIISGCVIALTEDLPGRSATCSGAAGSVSVNVFLFAE